LDIIYCRVVIYYKRLTGVKIGTFLRGL